MKHPDFDLHTLKNDIAIMKLQEDVVLNEYIQLACLPKEHRNSYLTEVGNEVIAAGWGSTNWQKNSYDDGLKSVKLKIQNPNKCKPVIKDYPKNWTLQLCVGDLKGMSDTCKGKHKMIASH